MFHEFSQATHQIAAALEWQIIIWYFACISVSNCMTKPVAMFTSRPKCNNYLIEIKAWSYDQQANVWYKYVWYSQLIILWNSIKQWLTIETVLLPSMNRSISSVQCTIEQFKVVHLFPTTRGVFPDSGRHLVLRGYLDNRRNTSQTKAGSPYCCVISALTVPMSTQ